MGLLDFSEFGLKGEEISLYDKPQSQGTNAPVKKVKTKEEIEEEALFDKSFTCPVCDFKLTTKKVRSGKVKLIGSDLILRAKYEQLDPTKYGVVSCPNCGYTALDRFFEGITLPQQRLVKEKVTPNFRYNPEPDGIYTYDYALELHKLALFNAIVKKSRTSERAYICLKMAWLCQGKLESLSPDAWNYEKEAAECKANMKEMYKNACEGFLSAIESEPFPMCGMDDMTVTYLLAALNMEIGEYDKAMKILSEIILSTKVKGNLKEKARDLRDEIQDRKLNGTH